MSSIRFGKIFGISLELHSTFILMMALIVTYLVFFEPQNAFSTILLLFFLFVSVFVHELFHSIVAVAKGVKVSRITLLPIGGLSMTEEFPEKPLDEFLIAIAGPAFNFIVVVLVLFLAGFFPSAWPQEVFFGAAVSPESIDNAITSYPLFAFFWVNLVLGVFNLFVPALPLDGGRVLRAILATRMGFSRATAVAARLSQGISIILFIIGIYANILLAVIAVFIFLGAGQETEIGVIKDVFRGLFARQLRSKRVLKIRPEENAKNALEKMAEQKQAIALVEMQRPSFVSAEMIAGIKKDEREIARIGEIAREISAIDANTSAEKAFIMMASKNTPILAVKEKGKTTGFILEDDVQRFLRIKKAEKRIN